MHTITRVSAVLLFLALTIAPALGHGVRTEVAVGAMTVVTFTHEDGSPMAATSFTVLAPGHTQPFLSGMTDVHGRVVFLPDEAGQWKVRVAGADGHGAVVTIAVDSTAVGMTDQPAAAVYSHDHETLETGATAQAAGTHDHAHEADGEHGHDHATPAGAAGERSFDAAVGLVVLVAVLGVAALVLRRRRG